MAKNKTTKTNADVLDFINTFAETEQRRKDGIELLKLMQCITGYKPVMWGPSIVGFGHYHYKYESGHEGEAPFVGFSPRKAVISLYIFTGLEQHEHLLRDLGKFKLGKACIYANKLADINQQGLILLINETIHYLKINLWQRLISSSNGLLFSY